MHDPGGSVRISLPQGVFGRAEFSSCGVYRYLLERSRLPISDKYALWIGMNPSTADADFDDPTVKREWGFTVRSGLDRMVKCNISAYRATNPDNVPEVPEWAFIRNQETILDYATKASLVIMAHGVVPKTIERDRQNLTERLTEHGIQMVCLGLTKAGMPRHPLYVKGDTPFVPYGRH